ncbi:hypothetical protein FH972_021458 [Carpinus fangiana]|uniref:Oxidoreductase AflY n=1 Tax=Carpinus fangiana TaxID=176857 RepID=A0A5N6KQ04_9ROSI|nr:hypothetical protein FH972_021458 [Carpinus fangiana]
MKQYAHNLGYQRPAVASHDNVVRDMQEPAKFRKYLGRDKYYHDFMLFFQEEMDKKGWQQVLNEQLFKRDELADDMLGRMFTGILHPIIHLGFGVEFEQPAIIAEALAQAAVHGSWSQLLSIEKKALERKSTGPAPTLLSLIRRARSGGRFADLAAQYTVSPQTLQEQTDEMIRTNAIFCIASQNPKHIVKMDFFLIHSLNSSIFFSRFLNADWIEEKDKVRLLEWKARADIDMYLSNGSPELLWNEVTSYKPKCPSHGWKEIFERTYRYEEDGHCVKMVRALANGYQLASGQVEDITVTRDDWLTMAHMAIDSEESGGPPFVRGSWWGVPLREGQANGSCRLA